MLLTKPSCQSGSSLAVIYESNYIILHSMHLLFACASHTLVESLDDTTMSIIEKKLSGLEKVNNGVN
jgi:hypothetical protein